MKEKLDKIRFENGVFIYTCGICGRERRFSKVPDVLVRCCWVEP
jgi:hypothetical protein